ncbi:MAG: hypothetical protein FJ216_03800 [Ignavibacteria bacterium]|nr:hypothetical protein [Ignavibacteria bacterium]
MSIKNSTLLIAALLTLLIFFTTRANGENLSDTTLKNVKRIVGKIIVVGNEITDEDIITRELETKTGDSLDLSILQEDLNRLANLQLFQKIEIFPGERSKDTIDIIISVVESFYILPIPQAGFQGGNLKRFWAGLNTKWRNFAGRNITLGLNFGIGFEPFVSFSYTNPWIGKNLHLFTSLDVSYSKKVNKSISTSNIEQTQINKDDLAEFDLNNYAGSLTIGKFFGRYISIAESFAYNVITTSSHMPGSTISTTGKDRYATLETTFNFDNRDIISYSTHGTYLNGKYIKYGIFNKDINFNRIRVDARKFIPIKLARNYSIVLCSRLYSSLAFGGNIPNYLFENFGFSKVLRGWDDYVIDGENLLGNFNEIRIPVIKPFIIEGKDHFVIKKLPLLKDIVYRYGLYLTLFYDVGGVWNKTDNIKYTRFKSGYGIGLNLLLPMDFIFRIDMAFRHVESKYKTNFVYSLEASF